MSTTGRSVLPSHRDKKVTCEEQKSTQSHRNPLTRTRNALERELPNRSLPDLRRQSVQERHQTHSELNSPVFDDHSTFPSCESLIRLILLGKTGAGKSSLGNLLLGFTDEAQQFEADESFESVTKQCAVGRSTLNDKRLVVIDTPGFFDTGCSTPTQKRKKVQEITKSVQKSFPGPHAFFIVLKVGRFTPEEQQAIKEIKEIFGSQILNFCVVIFTEKDKLDRTNKTIDQALSKASDDLKDFLKACGNRYIAVNNVEVDRSKKQQMREDILHIVTGMMKENGNAFFTSELLAKVKCAVIKINKEGMGRNRAIGLGSGLVSESAAAATAVGVVIVQDDELIPEIEAIVEEHVLHMLDNN